MRRGSTTAEPDSRVPALDGLRGCAVAAVVAFHVHWLRGGWLGVDLFFVLSGYLITRLLVAEAGRTGQIDLRAFWARRARRLIPAVLVLMVVAAWLEWHRHTRARVWDTIGALTYTSNWVQLATTAGYWDRFAPPRVLDHLWSLAIEEQFYLLWPLVVALLLRRRPSRLVMAVALATMTTGAAGYSLWLFRHGAAPSRIYVGTDSRIVTILAGAMLATLPTVRWPRAVAYVAGAAAAGTLVFMMATLRGTATFVYSGGLVLAAASAALLIAAVVASGRRTVLSCTPLVWLGHRSYGIYLWHWPLAIMFGVADRPRSSGVARAGVVVTSLAAAELSARLIELPIRKHGLLAFGRATSRVSRLAKLTVVLALVGAVVPSRRVAASAQRVLVPTTTTPRASAAAGQSSAPTDSSGAPGPQTAIMKLPRPPDRLPRVMVVGDSVGEYLATAVIKSPQSATAKFVNLARSNCVWSLVPVRTRIRPGDVIQDHPAECIGLLQTSGQVVEQMAPDAIVIVFGGGLFHQSEIGPGVWKNACTPEFASWFAGQISGTMSALGTRGTRVIVATEAYYRVPDEPDLSDRDDETDCKNAVIRSTAQTTSAYSVVEVGAFACADRSSCTDERGTILRPDGLHFSGPGALALATWLTDEVFEPPT